MLLIQLPKKDWRLLLEERIIGLKTHIVIFMKIDTTNNKLSSLSCKAESNLDMRKISADKLCQYKPDGYAIGGLSVGEKGNEFRNALRVSTENIPKEKPRYLMGVGSIPEIIDAIKLGVDMFDCVLPTRNARHGQLLTTKGKLNLRNAQYADDTSPIDESCQCRVCLQYSRGYLRHLHKSNELLAYSLSSFHNLAFMYTFMTTIRQGIMEGQIKENLRHYYQR